MMIRTAMILLIASACGGKSHSSTTTTAKNGEGGCPAAVTGAVTKAYPDATQSRSLVTDSGKGFSEATGGSSIPRSE